MTVSVHFLDHIRHPLRRLQLRGSLGMMGFVEWFKKLTSIYLKTGVNDYSQHTARYQSR